MTSQPSLFCESLADAIREAVRACGGSKVVGAQLWPEKAPEAAGRLLQDCLNDHRPEKLSPEQVMLVMRLARGRDCHAVMLYLARECGYTDPSPLDPETELAKSNREVAEALARATAAMERHERLFGKPRTVEARRA